MQVIPIKLRLSNAYLVLGERPILVDTGSPGEEDALLTAVQKAGIAPESLALVVHTHGHSDHAGSSAALQQRLQVPLGLHTADLAKVQQGRNLGLPPTSIHGRVMAPFVDKPFPPFTPDVVWHTAVRLDDYGVAGTIQPLPGHTAGSVALLLDNGEAIVGDVLMGGYLGGTVRPHTPRYHYFAEDLTAVRQSVSYLLGQSLTRLYVGHGGPLAIATVQRWAERQSVYALA